MKSERQTEAPLTPEDVQMILSICSPRGLLVGGQALAFWADHLQVERPVSLISGVTADAGTALRECRARIHSTGSYHSR